MNKPDLPDDAALPNKPESFARFEDFARRIIAVPKAEVDALEKEEKRKGRKRTPAKPSE